MLSIDTLLIQHLLETQFPHWANLPITPAKPQGWDNRTFRLGTTFLVRLPSAEGYAPQVAIEHRWLPFLAPHLPLPIPVPIALGQPNKDYPFPWSVYRWLDGEPVGTAQIADLSSLAMDLGAFLIALQKIDIPNDAPFPSAHNGYRGGSLSTYDTQTRHCIELLGEEIDSKVALEIWEAALATTWNNVPVWLHGDVAINNLLVQDDRLVAVIDFGCLAVGDPACDLVIAWTLFSGQSRIAFQNAIQLDQATWTRAKGWALWKALLVLVESRNSEQTVARETRRILTEILSNEQPTESLKSNLLDMLEETFVTPKGIYLDRAKGALFSTLENISAKTASVESKNQRSIAAHVEHLRVYLVALHGYMNGATAPTDWDASWQTQSVNELEWQALRENLKIAYGALVKDLLEIPDGDIKLAEVMAILTHSAYHFGAIRQLLLGLS